MIEYLFQVVPNDLTKQCFIFLLYVCVCVNLKTQMIIMAECSDQYYYLWTGRPKGDLRNTHFGVLSLGSSVMKIDGFILRVYEGEDYAFGKSFSSQILECHLKYQMGVKIFEIVKL